MSATICSRLMPGFGSRFTFVIRMSGIRFQPSARIAPPLGRPMSGAVSRRREVADEDPLLHERHRLRGHPLVVPPERPEPAGRGRVGDDVDELRAVPEAAAEEVGGEEARAGVARLRPEDAVELRRVAAALVDLEVELGRVEDDRPPPGRQLGGREQLDGLLGEPLRVSEEIEAADVLVPGGLEAAAGVGVAAALVLVALDRVRLDGRADVRDRLLGVGALGREEGLPLPLRLEQRLRERDALDPPHRLVGREEVGELGLDRDGERVLRDGGLVPARHRGPRVELDAPSQRGRGGAGDAHRVGGDAVHLVAIGERRGREAPGAVDDDADADPLALRRGRGVDPPRSDGEVLVEAVDVPGIRVRRAPHAGGLEGAFEQVSHRLQRTPCGGSSGADPGVHRAVVRAPARVSSVWAGRPMPFGPLPGVPPALWVAPGVGHGTRISLTHSTLRMCRWVCKRALAPHWEVAAAPEQPLRTVDGRRRMADETGFPGGAGTLVEALASRGVSRRRFLQFCSTMTAALALPNSYTPRIVACAGDAGEADGRLARVPGLRRQHGVAAAQPAPRRSPTRPRRSSRCQYHETIMAAAGTQAEANLDDVVANLAGKSSPSSRAASRPRTAASTARSAARRRSTSRRE